MTKYYIFNYDSYEMVHGPETADGTVLGHKGGLGFADVDHAFFRVDFEMVAPDCLSTSRGLALSPRAMDLMRQFKLGPELGVLSTTLLGKRGEELASYSLVYATKELDVLDLKATKYTPIPDTDLASEIEVLAIDESLVPDVDLFRERLSSDWVCSARLAEAFHHNGITNCRFVPIWPDSKAPVLKVARPTRARQTRVKRGQAGAAPPPAPPVDYSKWQACLRQTLDAVSSIDDGDGCLRIAPPADDASITDVEQAIGRPLPAILKEFFLKGTAELEVDWLAREDCLEELPGEMGEGVGGCLTISLERVRSLYDEWSDWIDCFEDPEYFPGGIQPSFKHDELFPLQVTMNGDMIVVVCEGSCAGEVYYVDHEGPDSSWPRIGTSIPDFLESWARIGCVGPDTCLEYFYDERGRKLAGKSRVAKLWLKRIGLI